jgi:hypothetical protein
VADENKRIHFIPPLPPKREKRVGIYCRVSTNSVDQLKSLTAQVSALTRLVAANPKWLLVDVYIDIASSKTGSSRKEFTRMLKDCKSRDIEIILTKSISRFGRDTVEILDALNQLRVFLTLNLLSLLSILPSLHVIVRLFREQVLKQPELLILLAFPDIYQNLDI